MEFDCPRCHLTCCVLCKSRPYHKNQTCEEHKEKENLDDQQFREFAAKQGYKPCPNCGQITERTYGCYHMKCGNPQCKVDFCDMCAQKLDPKKWKEHFNPPNKCVLWRNEEDLLEH